jgi:hypothetical protein
MLKALGITALIIIMVVGLVIFGVTATVIGTLSQEANLRSSIEAHERAREASFDTMKKIITQKSQLPAAAKSDLLKLLPEVVSGRAGGTIFKSVQEQYPEFTLGLYREISNSIESERHTFLNEQKELFDVKREHDSLLRRPVSGVICSMFGRRPVDVKVISSTEAKEVGRTGVDDNTDLGLGK